jgi:hypothetical protein
MKSVHMMFSLKPLTPNDLQRRRAVNPLKIKIPVKISADSVAQRGFNSGVKGLKIIWKCDEILSSVHTTQDILYVHPPWKES